MLEERARRAWILTGATASGKSAVAQWLAERHGAAVISADAMLVYRGMDIGTAKPTVGERGAVPYLGMDLVDPDRPFSAGDWIEALRRSLDALPPEQPLVVTGGTGLYLKALLVGLDRPAPDPAARERWRTLYRHEGLEGLQRVLNERDARSLLAPSDWMNPRRLLRLLETLDSGGIPGGSSVPVNLPTIVALRWPRESLWKRIEQRVDAMLAAGLLDEARRLREEHAALSATAAQAIGYAEALACLDGTLSIEEARMRMVVRTRRLAKRQATWLRHQLAVDWLDTRDDEPVALLAGRVMQYWRKHGASEIEL